jgi:hypothetical protein
MFGVIPLYRPATIQMNGALLMIIALFIRFSPRNWMR